jgi:predicted ribosome quality control (RQC) complex YloA/Tae2 family protein
MEPLNQTEVQCYLKEIKPLIVGAQLQDVWSTESQIICELYTDRALFLVFDLNPSPVLVLLDSKPKLRKSMKPPALFLRAHALGGRLNDLGPVPEIGRGVDLLITKKDRSIIQVRFIMVPGCVNLIVNFAEKKISWSRPRDLPRPMTYDFPIRPGLSHLTIAKGWLDRIQPSRQDSKSSVDGKSASVKKEKRRSLIEKLRKEETAIQPESWRQLGEWLKGVESIELLPNEVKSLYDHRRSRSENRDLAFTQMRALTRKQAGLRLRILQLTNELEQPEVPLQNSPKINPQANQIMRAAGAQGRRLNLPDGYVAFFGKHGKDNLALLRKARPHDLWVHLRDYPSAHAIIVNPQKNKPVPISFIEPVAQWIFSQKVRDASLRSGAKIEVLATECRFVRPIKGAAPGLVEYTNAKTFTFASK